MKITMEILDRLIEYADMAYDRAMQKEDFEKAGEIRKTLEEINQ